MFKLSRTTCYAIRAVIALAQHPDGRLLSCRELSRQKGMPERFLLQILRELVTQDILKSSRGVAGGYCLNKPARKISLLDILDVFSDPLEPLISDLSGFPSAARTQLVTALQRSTIAARSELKRVTIADLIRHSQRVTVVNPIETGSFLGADIFDSLGAG